MGLLAVPSLEFQWIEGTESEPPATGPYIFYADVICHDTGTEPTREWKCNSVVCDSEDPNSVCKDDGDFCEGIEFCVWWYENERYTPKATSDDCISPTSFDYSYPYNRLDSPIRTSMLQNELITHEHHKKQTSAPMIKLVSVDGGTPLDPLEPPEPEFPRFVCPALPGSILSEYTYKEVMKKLKDIPPHMREQWLKEALEEVAKRSGGSWSAEYSKLPDGSSQWLGKTTMDVLIVDRNGVVYKGNLANPNHFAPVSTPSGPVYQPIYGNLQVIFGG